MSDEKRVRDVFRELGNILGCSDVCNERCVFYEVGYGPGCPLNQFEDRVMDAIGR